MGSFFRRRERCSFYVWDSEVCLSAVSAGRTSPVHISQMLERGKSFFLFYTVPLGEDRPPPDDRGDLLVGLVGEDRNGLFESNSRLRNN